MSQALYRQYRPQTFADVVGQDVAVRTLRNAIETDRVAHAYLFTGTKGTGKTTLAKLLAKALNCVSGPTTDPCGTCEECVAIAEGRSLDVAEIDAASNTGIDSVRDKIIDTVAFQPTRGTRRVYIIDEAHQLSKSAFNALLKTIEEPPDHVVFVFCTTETHMMMATVRDRCQRITMRSPGPDTLHEVLVKVCATEGITADEPALRAVARAAQGSFRNALGTLEMLTTTFGTSFSRDEVLAHLGVVGEELLFDASDAVIDGDPGAVLRLVEQLVQDGVDLDQFARSLAEHLRTVLLQLHGLDQSSTVGDVIRLQAQATRADERRVLAAIDCIGDAATRMRIGSDPRIAIETALVRATQGLGLPLLAMRLAALEHGATGSYGQPLAGPVNAAPAAANPARTAPVAPAAAVAAPAPAAAPDPAAAPAPAAATPAASPPPRPAPAPPSAPIRAPAAVPAAAATPVVDPIDEAALGNVDSWWPQVAQRVAASPAHRPTLQQLRPESADSRVLVLRLTETKPITPKLRQALTTAVFDVTGRKLAVEVLEPAAAATGSAPPAAATTSTPAGAAPASSGAAAAPSPAKAAARSASATTPPASDEGIENLMTMFGATAVSPADTDDTQ